MNPLVNIHLSTTISTHSMKSRLSDAGCWFPAPNLGSQSRSLRLSFALPESFQSILCSFPLLNDTPTEPDLAHPIVTISHCGPENGGVCHWIVEVLWLRTRPQLPLDLIPRCLGSAHLFAVCCMVWTKNKSQLLAQLLAFMLPSIPCYT